MLTSCTGKSFPRNPTKSTHLTENCCQSSFAPRLLEKEPPLLNITISSQGPFFASLQVPCSRIEGQPGHQANLNFLKRGYTNFKPVPWQNSACCIMKFCAPAPCPDQCVLLFLPGSQHGGRMSHDQEKLHKPVTCFFRSKNIPKHPETMWPTTLQV